MYGTIYATWSILIYDNLTYEDKNASNKAI